MTESATLADYERDGVVCLRNAFDPRWIALTRRGIARNLQRPGAFFRDHTPAGSPGRYLFDFWTWPHIPEFRDLVFDSPAAALAARFLGARSVFLLMDNWFLREAGAATGAPWHHDEPYFDFTGSMCSVWFPLEPAPRETGLAFLRGSHRSGALYVAEQFSGNVPFDARDTGYEPVPDFDAGNDPRLISWDLEPGDCLVFDLRTLHGAAPGLQTETSHRMSLRFGAENTRFRPRGHWTREISEHLIALGQPVDGPPQCGLLPRIRPGAGPAPPHRAY